MSKVRVIRSGTLRLFLSALPIATAACATTGVPPSAPVPRISAEALAAGLAEADRLAARGCYLCLKEAAAAYASLIERSGDSVVATKALENNLMIVLRENELRIHDSGAREAAQALASRVPASYVSYFAVIGPPKGPAEAGHYVPPGPANRLRQGSGGQEARPYVHPLQEERKKLAGELEKEWQASAMKAYFYIAAALNAGLAETLKPQLEGIVSAHPHDLSLKYQLQAFRPTFSIEASRALIGQETGFGEVHLLLGSRSMLAGRMDDAHRDLTRARELLPDSASVAAALASVKMAYARYAEALVLYEQVLALWPDDTARLGKVRALSHLGRHEEAIALLDELLKDARNTPGEKYYWRAWNRLRLNHLQAAYDDARATLNVMRNDAVYRLAGIASLRVEQLGEARTYFEGALQMNAADCDSLAYLGQLDAVQRNAKPAFVRYSSAVACYDQQLAGMAVELARHEQDISGLSNGLIATLRAQMSETQALRAASMKHADMMSKGADFQIP